MKQITLFCSHCRFKWRPRASFSRIPERCGNCGTQGSVRIEPDAEQILRESAEMNFRTG